MKCFFVVGRRLNYHEYASCNIGRLKHSFHIYICVCLTFSIPYKEKRLQNMVTEQSQRCTPTNTDCIKIQNCFLCCSIFPSFSSTETFMCIYILAHWMLVVGSKNENNQASSVLQCIERKVTLKD